jgi:hypothetical protein
MVRYFCFQIIQISKVCLAFQVSGSCIKCLQDETASTQVPSSENPVVDEALTTETQTTQVKTTTPQESSTTSDVTTTRTTSTQEVPPNQISTDTDISTTETVFHYVLEDLRSYQSVVLDNFPDLIQTKALMDSLENVVNNFLYPQGNSIFQTI